MSTCPFCSQPAVEGAMVCKNCGKALVRRCPYCAEDVAVLAIKCRHCGSDIGTPGRGAPLPVPAGAAPVGTERNLVVTLLLCFITCGIWGLVALYDIGTDLNAHRRRADLSPGLDILLGLLTCGIWFIFVLYRYAQVLKEITEEEGGPVQDVTTICLVLQLCKYIGCPGIVSVLVLQNELNIHWKRHRPA